MALGNTSVSGLLSSANAAAKKNRAYEDQLATFEWESSQKTSSDWLTYKSLLEKRVDTASDPSEQLSYMTRLRSAQRSWFSEEIQRESIKIQLGQGSLAEKYSRVVELFNQAVAIGDNNAAQNLLSQINSIDIQLQNEMASAASAYKDFQANAVKSANELADLVFKQEGTFKAWNAATGTYIDLPTLPEINKLFKNPSSKNNMFEQLGKEAAEQGGGPDGAIVGIFDAAIAAIQGVAQNLYAEASQLTDEAEANKLKNRANALLTGTTYEDEGSVFDIAGQKLTLDEMVDARDALNQGYSLFDTRQTDAGEYVLERKENALDWVYLQRMDENNNIYYEPTKVFRNSGLEKGLDTFVKDKLGQFGYDSEAIEIEGNTIKLTTPAGLKTTAVITPSGNLRFTEFGQIKTLDIDTGAIRDDNPLIKERFDDDGNFLTEMFIPEFEAQGDSLTLKGARKVDFDMSKISGSTSVAAMIRRAQRSQAETLLAEQRKAEANTGSTFVPLREANGQPGYVVMPNPYGTVSGKGNTTAPKAPLPPIRGMKVPMGKSTPAQQQKEATASNAKTINDPLKYVTKLGGL